MLVSIVIRNPGVTDDMNHGWGTQDLKCSKMKATQKEQSMALPTRRVSQERNHPKINFDGSIMTIDRIKAVLHVLFDDETPKIRVIGTSVIRITSSKVGNFC